MLSNKIILFSVILLSIGLISGSDLIYKQNTELDLKVPCFNNNTFCSSIAKCNITILYPNGSMFINNKQMTNQISFHNYTITSDKTSTLGEYVSTVVCFDGDYSGYSTFKFIITPTGNMLTTSQGGLSIGILISIIVLMFFFGYVGFTLMKSNNTFPIGLFFLLVSIIVSIYGLYLGVVFSSEYLYSSVSAVQSKVFVGIMWGLVGIMFIALLGLIIMALKEIKERKSIQKYGDGYDFSTKMYKY